MRQIHEPNDSPRHGDASAAPTTGTDPLSKLTDDRSADFAFSYLFN
jgi:hypothetical protein